MADPKLYKRGATWWTRIQGKRISTGCKARDAALLAARRLEREAADPAHKAAAEVTLEGALDAHIAAAEARGCARGTVTMYEEKAGHLIRVLGGALPLVRINAGAVDSYLAQRQLEGAHPHTLAKELSTLRQTLKIQKRRGAYPHDLAAVLPVRWSSGYQPKDAWLTPAQLEALCAELRADRAAYVLAWVATGTRESELYQLREQDIDRRTGVVFIPGTKTAGSADEIPILPIFAPLLERALRDAPGAGGLLSHLFPVWGNAWRDITAACRRAGVPEVGPHGFRHTAGQWLRRAGVAPHLIGRFLRHVDSRMVERVYAPLDAPGLAALIGNMGVSKPRKKVAR